MKRFLVRMFVVFLPFSSFGGNENYWLIRETNLWFSTATSPTIVVGRFGFHEKQNALETIPGCEFEGVQPSILVEEVLKGPRSMERLSIGVNVILPKERNTWTNCTRILFFSKVVDPEDIQYLGETALAPTLSLPATLDIVRQLKDEIRFQKNETEHFKDLLSSFSVPFDEEIRARISSVIKYQGETDEIEQLCEIDLEKIPALLCSITNDIPLKPTTLAFVNRSKDDFEPVARYEVSSTVGMISVIADRLLGMGIFSAYSDTTPSDRKHLQNMWQVYVLRWLEQSEITGYLPRPAIVWEPKVEGDIFP